MSAEAYERERYTTPLSTLYRHTILTSFSQNNSRIEDLASKVSALRGVTIDIYDNARDHTLIDTGVRTPPQPTKPLTQHVLICATSRTRHSPTSAPV